MHMATPRPHACPLSGVTTPREISTTASAGRTFDPPSTRSAGTMPVAATTRATTQDRPYAADPTLRPPRSLLALIAPSDGFDRVDGASSDGHTEKLSCSTQHCQP